MPFGSQELTDIGVNYLEAQAQLGDELRITRITTF